MKPGRKHVLNYIHELKTKMQVSQDITNKETHIARHRSKQWYDKNALDRCLSVRQNVLMYLPVEGKPLATKLHGPYQVLDRQELVNYLIETPDR